MNKNDYLSNKNVAGFVDYFSKIIIGTEEFERNFIGRSPVSALSKPIKQLSDALEEYKWYLNAKRIGNFEENDKVLESIALQLREAFQKGDESSLIQAIDECLLWGDGYKKGRLYKSNMAILEEQVRKKNITFKEYLQGASEVLCSEVRTPDFSLFNRRKGPYALNAGMTKVYALLNDNFIIYDSRVAAALGSFVIDYVNNLGYGKIDPLLEFRCLDGKKGQSNPINRNPSMPDEGLIFKMISSHKQHAEWNVRANWVLSESLIKANNEFCGFQGQKALRAVEAALFMIGYDIPREVTSVLSSPTSNCADRAVGSARMEIYNVACNFIKGQRETFSPRDLFNALSSKTCITKSQIRSALYSDRKRYEKVDEGIYRIR
jgi:hypothetical protein